ncbi:TrmH family RNA methyltransferase [Solitalea lacus]|uniref:TrmH family RNA methyltransferase n=1 Tax=Solitalea lacus TaxID=2911172 RepID=UPI001EDA5B6C|nr:RNA methyltransferase [Solitalea lacus]UKJ06460.1 RNA methyltransferase [Solitalea lacus]
MISKSQISFVKSLHNKKYREEHGLFIVEGVKMVNELLASSFIIQSIFTTENYLKNLTNINPKAKKIDVNLVTEPELQKISTLQTPNEVIALAQIPFDFRKNHFDIAQIKDKWTIMLDDVQDPGNLGTIIRIADWFGIKTLITSLNSVEAYNPKVVQSTMGSIFRVEVLRIDIEQILQAAKVPVYGALLEGDNLYKAEFSKPGVILMGNESKGISDRIRKYITAPLSIPSFGQAESLNVGIATAIFCSEMRRRQ